VKAGKAHRLIVYFVLRSDSVRLVYGPLEGYAGLGIPYMPQSATKRCDMANEKSRRRHRRRRRVGLGLAAVLAKAGKKVVLLRRAGLQMSDLISSDIWDGG